MNKGGYEFSFAWIFAVIIGAVIIFLAVYATLQFTETRRVEGGATAGKQLGTILNPVETNLEDAKTATIIVNEETRIFNECNQFGTFGFQEISTTSRSRIGRPWIEDRVKSSFRNKYIFSNETIQSESEFYVLSKPFEYPFKVANILIMWPDSEVYCFSLDPQLQDMEDEIRELELKNIILESNPSSCPEGSITVCHSSACDIQIQTNSGIVKHKGKPPVYYVESFDPVDRYSLLYAAIFSDPEVYDCQVGRLAKRASALADLYRDKSIYLEQNNCGGSTLIQTALSSYANTASNIKDSSDSDSNFENSQKLRINLHPRAQTLKLENDPLRCELF